MILDTLVNRKTYTAGKLPSAFEWLAAHAGERLAPGRIELGDGLYALVQELETKPVADAVWESHRRYIDVQYLIEGDEVMGWAPEPSLEPSAAYDESRDCRFYRAADSTLLSLKPGMFAVFFPQDGHATGLHRTTGGKLRKIVVKVPLS